MSQTSQPSAGDAASRLTRDTAELIRAELDRARDELIATARRTGVATAMLGSGGVCGVLALATGTTAMLRLFEKAMPPTRAAILLSTLYAGAGAGLAVAGVRRLQAARAAATAAMATADDDVRHARDTAA